MQKEQQYSNKVSPYLKCKTRTLLAYVAPLGRPRSVYKGKVEYRFLSRNGVQMTLNVNANNLNFQ